MRGRITLAAAALLAGCAGPQIAAQWSDPQFVGQPPRGAAVLVACQAPDLTLRRVCADRFGAKLQQLGARPLLAADPGDGPPPDEAALRAQAQAAGAAAWLRVSLMAEVAVVAPGPTIGIGIGGFGGGYRSGGGIGFGMSAPIGGAGPADTGYGASASLSDTRSGQLMWSGRASAAPSADAGAQLATLATQLLEAARQSGLFPPAP
jgi:hypothetical protein